MRTPLDQRQLEAAKLAYAVGNLSIKEACSKFNLPYESARKAFQRSQVVSPVRVKRESERAIHQQVTEVLAAPIADRATRYIENLSKAGERFSEVIAGYDGETLVKKSRDIAAMDAVSRKALGIDREREDRNAVNIAVLGDISTLPSEIEYYRERKQAAPNPQPPLDDTSRAAHSN